MSPPPVDPAQPPMKDKISSITGKKWGQSAKSWVVNPVVVAMETVWNMPWISPSVGGRVWVINSVAQVTTMAMQITLQKNLVSESPW